MRAAALARLFPLWYALAGSPPRGPGYRHQYADRQGAQRLTASRAWGPLRRRSPLIPFVSIRPRVCGYRTLHVGFGSSSCFTPARAGQFCGLLGGTGLFFGSPRERRGSSAAGNQVPTERGSPAREAGQSGPQPPRLVDPGPPQLLRCGPESADNTRCSAQAPPVTSFGPTTPPVRPVLVGLVVGLVYAASWPRSFSFAISSA